MNSKNTVDFLLINWSFKTAVAFLDKFFLKINNISLHPYGYSKSVLGRNIRRCLVTKHITLYYKIKKNIKYLSYFCLITGNLRIN